MVVLGVLVMNTGTPDEPTPEAIRPYLKQFLSDRNLIDMPPALWQPILNMFILPNRPKRTAPHYQAIWTPEGSPFLLESRALGHALENQLGRLLGASDACSTSQEAAANACVKVALGSDIAGGDHLHMFDVVAASIRASKARRVLDNWETDFLTVPEGWYLATSAGAAYFAEQPGFAPGNHLHALVLADDDLPQPHP